MADKAGRGNEQYDHADQNGETQLRVRPVGWSQELTTLGTEFNEMLDRMQVMAQEELQHKMLVERTEYKMLQAQTIHIFYIILWIL